MNLIAGKQFDKVNKKTLEQSVTYLKNIREMSLNMK